MVADQKVTGLAASVPGGLAMGAGVSLAVTLSMAAMAAYLEGKGVIRDTGVGYCVMVTLLLSAFLGALTAAGKIKRQRLIMCMASGACYYLLLIGITALFFGGQYTGVGVTAALIAGASAAAAFLHRPGGKSTSVRKRKFKNR